MKMFLMGFINKNNEKHLFGSLFTIYDINFLNNALQSYFSLEFE